MRDLVCTRCHEQVTVHEVALDGRPCPFIDPDLYVCGQCLQPVPGQLELDQRPRTEVRPYDPQIAEVPF